MSVFITVRGIFVLLSLKKYHRNNMPGNGHTCKVLQVKEVF